MANNVKKIWASGKAVVNGWLAIPTGFSAEVMAQGGLDSVTVDMQHGVQDYQSMVPASRPCRSHPILPMVRVPWNEPGIVGKVLDAGAYGVICPMINTKKEAEAFVTTANIRRWAAAATGRSAPASTATATSYQTAANDEIAVHADDRDQGGDRQPRRHPRRRRAWTASMSARPTSASSMGLAPILDRQEPEILKIYEKLIKECGKRGIFAGIHTGSAECAALHRHGLQAGHPRQRQRHDAYAKPPSRSRKASKGVA